MKHPQSKMTRTVRAHSVTLAARSRVHGYCLQMNRQLTAGCSIYPAARREQRKVTQMIDHVHITPLDLARQSAPRDGEK